MTIRIANAPCSWGVEFADDPRNPGWETVLKQCAEAGYKGIELGPVGYLPEDPEIPGDGEVDFPAVRQVLMDADFEGWCTVEQDCDPQGDTSPIEDAVANRTYLQSTGFN